MSSTREASPEYSVVRRSGNKRKGRSPRASATAKRARPAQNVSSSSESESDSPRSRPTHRANPLPLEQRISDAPVRQDPANNYLPPLLPLPPPVTSSSSASAANPSRSLPPVFHTASLGHGGPHHRSRDLPQALDTPDPQAGELSAHRHAYPGTSRETGPSSSRPPAHASGSRGVPQIQPTGHYDVEHRGVAAWVEVGPVTWGARTRETFGIFCDHIEAAEYGPAPRPIYVTNADERGYVRAKFVGGNYRNARENAQGLADAWNIWAHTTGTTAGRVSIVD
ncbi:hypothetical protein C8F04DRAFT_1263321 [Mycena alexandri]|uniref:Uncharacterized protein n=1 Tax=Mycena alexandri TaxID=1745969 RepID=A0AAD6SP36_9AGAR|nr:hypothetical protein C8F04DRAFT_1263321 [Mycena alexandri]